jgi:sugar O-acyltransferase (sialic acid O-acetyltransferase NeuD family)
MKKNIAIVGASGHAKVIADIIEKEGTYSITGFIDIKLSKGSDFYGYKVIGHQCELKDIYKKYDLYGIIIGIGSNSLREKVANLISAQIPKVTFISAIHPAAQIAKEVIIGEGTVIMAGAIINSSCKIDRFCVINTNSSLDHDSHLSEFSSLAPGSCCGGGCNIGKNSFVGLGANLIHGIKVGDHTVIGAGSTLVKNADSNSVYYGVPAKKVKSRQTGDSFL